MRVLFSSTSGHGHVAPMVPLARALRAGGHEVLWATSAEAVPVVAGADLEAVPCGASGREEAALRADVRDRAEQLPGEQRAGFVFPRMFGAALAPRMAADLLALAEGWRPDLLIHEHAELASPLVGAVCGVPSLTHSYGGPVPVPHLTDAGELLRPMWAAHGLEVPSYAGCYEATYLDICPGSVRSVPLDHIRDVHPLRPAERTTPLPTDGPEPLVYVTFGTVQERPELLRQVLAATAQLAVRVLVAVGRRIDPATLGPQPGHVRVESWVDQATVLRQASAVVSHGGSGTFLGALAQGLPQLCLPQAADQFRNAEGGRQAGAALVLRPGEITDESVRTAVGRLLGDIELQRCCDQVAAEVAAMPSPVEVAKVVARRYALG
jgi:UDP:flavonoid glycosyltransferase YjiC (YdhE family)